MSLKRTSVIAKNPQPFLILKKAFKLQYIHKKQVQETIIKNLFNPNKIVMQKVVSL